MDKTPPCDCHSYNGDSEAWDETERVPARVLPVPASWEWEKDRVCVDECIADTVAHLWEAGVVTLNSCCGHNTRAPSIVLDSNLGRGDGDIVRNIIAQIDSRNFQLLSWKLTEI